MQIDIQHIAKLSRLSIEKEKVEKFQKEMFFLLLFRLYEKVTKRDVFMFFLLLQKEPKSSRGSALRPRFKALHRHAFYKNCSFPCLKQLLGFEPVRKGNH